MLDEMPLYLVDLLMDHAYLIDQAAAERMRMICWMTAQVNSKKRLKPEDIMKFTWEDRAEEDIDNTPMTAERWKTLQQKAQAMRRKIIGNG